MSYQQKQLPLNESQFRPIPRADFYDKKESALKDRRSKVSILLMVAIFSCIVLMVKLSGIAENINCKLETEVGNAITPTRISHPKTAVSTKKQTACGKRIIGYYSEYESTDITKNQLSKLTHAVFAYIKMNWDGTLRFKNAKAKQRFLSLKNKSKSVESDVKVMFSIGGEENSQYFSSVAADPINRKTFINSIDLFIQENKIDGVDLYWKRANENDKYNYISLLRDLRRKLKELGRENKKYIISITLPAAGIENWEMAYDLDQTLDYVDFINVFSMDYYGPWLNKWGTPAGPISPLYTGVAKRNNFNVDWTIEYYVCKTKQPNKFNIVIPFFARFWKNVKEAVEPGKEVFRNVELKDNKAEGNPYMSRWTAEHEGWKLTNSTWDEASKSSYIWNPRTRTFLTFETEKSIAAKTNYVNEKNLGGVWIWSVDMDDEKNSLLNTLSSTELCSSSSEPSIKYQC